MIVKGIRYGYDGGGMACGPVEGSFNTEVCVVDDKGELFFVACSRIMEFENIYVSETPLYDILTFMMQHNVDCDRMLKKLEAATIEGYDYELPDYDEEIKKSRFAKAIQLAQLAMNAYLTSEEPDADVWGGYEDFVDEYLEMDLDDMDLPEPVYGDGDDDEYEEENPEE